MLPVMDIVTMSYLYCSLHTHFHTSHHTSQYVPYLTGEGNNLPCMDTVHNLYLCPGSKPVMSYICQSQWSHQCSNYIYWQWREISFSPFIYINFISHVSLCWLTSYTSSIFCTPSYLISLNTGTGHCLKFWVTDTWFWQILTFELLIFKSILLSGTTVVAKQTCFACCCTACYLIADSWHEAAVYHC